MPNTPNGSAAPAQLKLNLRPDTAELEPLSLAVEAFGADRDWSPALVMQINLVLEEIIVNTIDYGYPDGRAGRIEVVLEADASAIHIQIEDDADAFDPFAEAPRPDIAAVLADRPIGGLGVHLVRHYMDVCAYRRVPGRNLISLVKRLPSPRPRGLIPMLLLLFKLGARRYALDAMAVAQVLPVPTLEPAPPGPQGLAGLLRYRGGLVPVLDLRQIAEGEPCVLALSSRVILVGGRDGLLGLLAEHVTDTAHLDAAHQLAAIARQSGPDWLDPTLYEDEEGLAQRVHWAALLTPELRALAGPEVDPP